MSRRESAGTRGFSKGARIGRFLPTGEENTFPELLALQTLVTSCGVTMGCESGLADQGTPRMSTARAKCALITSGEKTS